MRRVLITGAAAITSMVALAFIVPLVLTTGSRGRNSVFVDLRQRHPALSVVLLVLVGLLLVATAVLLADRLATRLVRSAREMAEAAAALGAGDLDVRISPTGPYEFLELGVAFNLMASRMRQHIHAERELAADLSHRLRTPLTALRLGVAALPQDAAGQQVAEVSAWLEQEVDAVIAAARSGNLSRDRSDCDAAAVLRDRMSFWSTLAEDEGREAYYLGPTHGIRVPLPRDDLSAAVDVLLGNVFRHTPYGVGFRLVLTCPSEEARITVEDAGQGFPAAPSTTSAVVTGELPIQTGTSRLGLDIVRRMVKSTGGRLLIGRSPLGGALVTLHIPVTGPQTLPRRRDRRFTRISTDGGPAGDRGRGRMTGLWRSTRTGPGVS